MDPLGPLLGRPLASLGRLLAALGALLNALGPLLGRSLAHLVAPGRFWAALMTPGRVPRVSQDPFWNDFGTVGGRFGDELGKNLGTT